jgi:hypothetical protein
MESNLQNEEPLTAPLQANSIGRRLIQRSFWRALFPAIASMIALLSIGAFSQIASTARPVHITPPPMGWSSWNSFSNTIDAKIVVEQTEALISSGLKGAGYQYINIDEGWWQGKRDVDGNILVDPKQWPALLSGETAGDMGNIVRFIHKAGLKAGIYTDAGESGCSFYGPDLGPPMPHTGSEGHYDEDFLQFAKWGFDYVKVDWCGGSRENLDPAVQYAEIARAIARAETITGRPLYFSICDWGSNSPWTWAPGIAGVGADIWRTSGDIVAPIVANTPNGSRRATLAGVFTNFDHGIHPQAQHTGYYNDPDMMVLGMPGLSDAENRVHMSLWAISGAPLILGADLTTLTDSTRATLTNRDVIAVDQDALGLQAIKVEEPQSGVQVWTKPLSSAGTHAVLLLNRTSAATSISAHWSAIGLDPELPATVRDAWAGQDVGAYKSEYAVTVGASDAILLIVHGTDRVPTRYEAASDFNVLAGKAALQSCKSCVSGRGVGLQGDGSLTFRVNPLNKSTFAHIHYLNPGTTSAVGQLRVDGQLPTNIQFPPTDVGTTGIVALEIESASSGRPSTLSITSPSCKGLLFDSLSVFHYDH